VIKRKDSHSNPSNISMSDKSSIIHPQGMNIQVVPLDERVESYKKLLSQDGSKSQEKQSST